MRLLNKEEIVTAMQEAHPAGEGYRKWNIIIGRLKREVEAVAKAQHQLDLKEFIEWGERLDKQIPGYISPEEADKWRDSKINHVLGGREPCLRIPWKDWQSLKKLMEEQ